MSAGADSIAEIEVHADLMSRAADATLVPQATALADAFLAMSETILETWLVAHDLAPTDRTSEGFRLLALHKQAARGNATFNACRETCREIVYLRNVVQADRASSDTGQRVRLLAMVVRHLALFVGGKLEVAGLGDFCCSSRPLRQAELLDPHSETL